MKRAYWISLGTLAGVMGAVYGCGGVGGADGLFNGGSGGATSSADGQMTTSSNVGSTSGSGNPTSTSSASGAGGMSGSSSGSGDTSSSSGDTSSSSVASTSSSSGGGPTIPCGAAMCPLGAMNACCWDNGQKNAMCVKGDPANDGCNTDPGPGGFQSRIECHAPSDCPGAICCGHLNQGGISWYNIVTCQATCNANTGNIVICDPNGAPCQQGMCHQSAYLPQGYFVCG